MRLWRGGVSSAEAATRYVELGYTVVPVPPGEKNPGRRGWERLRISLEEVPNYFTNGQNVGIHCGEPSGWLVPADLDAPEAVKLGGRFLPPLSPAAARASRMPTGGTTRRGPNTVHSRTSTAR